MTNLIYQITIAYLVIYISIEKKWRVWQTVVFMFAVGAVIAIFD